MTRSGGAADVHIGRRVRVSFQRYPVSAAGVSAGVPSSWGLLPAAPDGGVVLVPLADGEGCWIGLTAIGSARTALVCAAVECADGTWTDAVSGSDAGRDFPLDAEGIVVSPFAVLAGIAAAKGEWWALSRAPDGPTPIARAVRLVSFLPRRAPRPPASAGSRPPLAHDNGGNAPSQNLWATRAHVAAGAWRVDRPQELRVELIDPKTFLARTGHKASAALDPSAPYQGWRLP